jgi:predicted DCC family thiol-disulfide oxidoreductase YuxK
MSIRNTNDEHTNDEHTKYELTNDELTKYEKYNIVLFDGVCNLCNGAVQFIIKRDKRAYFRFASLQSELGQALLSKYGLLDKNIDSIVLLSNKKAHCHSGAALRIARRMSGLYPLLYVFMLIPYFLRNWIYKWVARNRYRWFGRQAEGYCMMPTPELKERLL